MSPVRFLVAPQKNSKLCFEFFLCNTFYLTHTKMLKLILRIVGTISLILGILGIVLPVLPTTPFLLLTAYCYLRSAPNWHRRLLESKHLGPYIRNFQEHKCIPLRIKIYSISTLWATICISAFVFVSLFWVRLLLLAIAIGVTIHILSYPNKP